MGDFIKTLTSLIGSIKAKTDGKIGILQKRIDDIPTETVLYTPQTLTEEQQKQARNNIGAESSFIINITGSESSGWKADKTFQEIDAAVASGVMPVCKMPKHVTDSYGYGVCYYAFKLEPPFESNVFLFRNLDTDKTYSAYTVVEISSSNDVDVRRTTMGMVGATETEPGDSGYVPSPQSGDNTKFLRGDGRWADVEGDTSLGITGATPGQIAKITAVDTDGKPTKWEPVEMASGGDGTKAWTKIIDADVTETTSSFRAEGLANVTEFDILWSNLQNITTTKSGLNAVINNIQVAGSSSTAIVGSSGSSLYGWTRLTYDGLFWHVQRSAGAIVADNIAAASIIYATYNLVRGVGAATSFALNAPTMYAPVSGKLEVWAR